MIRIVWNVYNAQSQTVLNAKILKQENAANASIIITFPKMEFVLKATPHLLIKSLISSINLIVNKNQYLLLIKVKQVNLMIILKIALEKSQYFHAIMVY